MRIFISRGVVFSFVFLAIVAVSNAFVFWIPIWKTTTVLRYQPKKGWYPLKTSGSGILKKPKTYYPFHSPSHHHHLHKPHHHYRSTFRHPYHHKYNVHSHHDAAAHKHRHWIKPVPLLNLNHHHPLCPLCHLADWSKKRKLHHHGPHFFDHSPKKHFASPVSFPKSHHHLHSPRAPFFSHFPKPKPFHYSGIHHSPKPIYLGKFNDLPAKFEDFPKFSSSFHHQPYHHPRLSHHHHPHHPKANYLRSSLSSSASGIYDRIRKYPLINHAPSKSSPKLQFPKDFSNFGFNGFGSGQRGHGWGGWDW